MTLGALVVGTDEPDALATSRRFFCSSRSSSGVRCLNTLLSATPDLSLLIKVTGKFYVTLMAPSPYFVVILSNCVSAASDGSCTFAGQPYPKPP